MKEERRVCTRRFTFKAGLGVLFFWSGGLLSVAQTKIDSPRELWAALKKALLADNGEEYFKSNVRNSELNPSLKGVVLTVLSNGESSKAILAMSDAKTAEVTLVILQGNAKFQLKAGTEIEFVSDGLEFTKTPFMLTLVLHKLLSTTPLP